MNLQSSIFSLSPRKAHWLYWLLCLVIAGRALRHIAAGFALPLPWPDESSFLWQAIAFQRHNTLFAPELNPLREVLWMPPGYMLVMGMLFKIFGVSFALARTVSLACVIGAFLLLASIARKYPYPFAGLALLGVAFLSSPVTAIGNTARMDAMVILCAAASMVLLQRKQAYAALALVSITPLIHPNGLFFCAAAFGYAATARMVPFTRAPHPNRLAIWAAILSGIVVFACWTAYIAHIAGHWGDFCSDIASQFHHNRAHGLPILSPGNIAFALVIGGAFYYGRATKTLPALPAWFGAAMWLLYGVSTEAWYECFYAVAFALLIHAALPVVITFARASFPSRQLRGRAAAMLVLLLLLVSYTSVDFYKSFTGAPFSGWFGMRMESDGTPYITAGDESAVRAYLASLRTTGPPLMVQFLPEADALFYPGSETNSVRFCQGTFYPFNPDVYIFHSSRYLSGYLKERFDYYTTAIGTFPTDTILTITSRDSTEMWRGIQRIK